MSDNPAPGSAATLDEREVERFTALAREWWDPRGKFAPLHKINPTRLTYIRDQLCDRFGRERRDAGSLSGLTIADIGCGGGLLCEPLARLGAEVTGIDPGAESIEVARLHAAGQGLTIDYRAETAAALAASGARFDAVLAMEVVEHVPDLTGFLRETAALIKPGGLLVLSTINRTLKSYALAIVAAEYVLRWLPVGTHQWDRFVTPSELAGSVRACGLKELDRRGMVLDPLRGEWGLSDDTDVNYLMTAELPQQGPESAKA